MYPTWYTILESVEITENFEAAHNMSEAKSGITTTQTKVNASTFLWLSWIGRHLQDFHVSTTYRHVPDVTIKILLHLILTRFELYTDIVKVWGFHLAGAMHGTR